MTADSIPHTNNSSVTSADKLAANTTSDFPARSSLGAACTHFRRPHFIDTGRWQVLAVSSFSLLDVFERSV